jgi:hypothetical protein
MMARNEALAGVGDLAEKVDRRLTRPLTAPPPDRADHQCGENPPEDCCNHILLGIPNVALTFEISRAEIRMN